MGGSEGDVVQALADNVIPSASDLSLNGITFDIAGHGQSIGSLSGDGTVLLDGAQLTVGSNGNSTEFEGVINGIGELIKTGGGEMRLLSGVSFDGSVSVNDGDLKISGSIGDASELRVSGNGIVSGSGAINVPIIVTGNGSISPGDQIGGLTTETVQLSASAAMRFELAGLARLLLDELQVRGAEG